MVRIIITPKKNSVMHKLDKKHLLATSNGYYFFGSPEVRSRYDALHVTLLMEWLSGALGPLNKPHITRDYVLTKWNALGSDYYLNSHAIRSFYIDKEMHFWNDFKK